MLFIIIFLRMKIECVSFDSSDNEEHLSDVDDHTASEGNDYAALCVNSWVQCDFCDLVFDNRFSLIKHNASHIIIPLIKQTHQCTVCLRHFTALDDFNTHICITNIKTEKVHSNEDLLQSIIEKEVIVKCEDDFKDVFLIKSPNIKTELPENTYNTELPEGTVRNRLLFEDDEEDSSEEGTVMSNGLNIEFNKLIKSFNDPMISLQNQDGGIEKILLNGNQNMLASQKVEKESQERISQNLEVIYSKPIHYDRLIKEENTVCRFCGKRFPNRFELLKHEPKHMKLRRFRYTVCGFCETYIAGNYRNLRRHIDQKHPGKNYNKFNLHKCNKCQLSYFNYKKHNQFYHMIYKCEICWKGYEKEEDLEGHQCDGYNAHNYNDNAHNYNNNAHNGNDKAHNGNDTRHNKNGNLTKSAMMKLCDMCYTFQKFYMQKRHNYEQMGELSEIGVRQTCDKCNNKFFVVKLVKRECVVKEPLKHKKILTNADRLKRVQNRLKMIQYKNKF